MAVGAVGAVVLFLVIIQGFGGGSSGPSELEQVKKQVQDAETKVARGEKLRKELVELQNRSLPSDRNVAGSQYSYWLTDKLERTHLASKVQAQKATVNAKDRFTRYTFDLTASGTLEQISHFLYEFYAAGHLHKIVSLTIKPEKGTQLTMHALIEAIGLDDAASKNKLPVGAPSRLAEKDFAIYKKAIVGRDMFAKYVPPKPPPPPVASVPRAPDPPPPAFDHAKFARVTSLFQTPEGSEAFLRVMTTDEMLTLKAGDEFTVGTIKGLVTKITQQGVEFVADGKLKMVPLGKALTEATTIEEVGTEEPGLE